MRCGTATCIERLRTLDEPAGRRARQLHGVRRSHPSAADVGVTERDSTVRIALLFPELLGTYGDGGNAVVLTQRLRWRGFDARARARARSSTRFRRRVTSTCSAVARTLRRRSRPSDSRTAGWQQAVDERRRRVRRVRRLPDPRSHVHRRGWRTATWPRRARLRDPPQRHSSDRRARRAAHRDRPSAADGIREPRRHHRTRCANATPLGSVLVGSGNGTGGVEGVVTGKVVGTYLHGPALARNPALADLLLSWVVGALGPDRRRGRRRAARPNDCTEALSSRRAGRST